MNQISIKRALISVSDKTRVVEIAKFLDSNNVEIISTGGTYNTLKENGIKVKKVSEVTNSPEILDGRVKTLHPKIHGALLANLDIEEHKSQLLENGITKIDLVILNLYPFEEVLKKGLGHNEMIENIDIGGPAMLRASAKNYKWTTIVTSPNQYDELISELINNNFKVSYEFRKKLAFFAFSLTSFYDSMIANYFKNQLNIESEYLNIGARKIEDLRYGENPIQSAAVYGEFDSIFHKLHGKELSYNNIVDIDASAKLILEFEGEKACAIIKHTNPSGVGIGNNLKEAYQKAFATDNVSPFGGIFCFNAKIDLECAEEIHKIFSEVIIAPDYDDAAIELLKSKKDRRLIKVDLVKLKNSLNTEIKSVSGGFLKQDYDKALFDENNIKTVSKRKESDEEFKAMMFAWKVAKHVKSNAIVYALKDRTLGVGAGQMSRVDSARIAREKAKQMGLDLKGSCLASDAFFPFADGLEMAADAGSTAVIQPGGSIRDNEVIEAADNHNIAMIFTGARHFKH